MKTTLQPFSIHIPDLAGETTERIVTIEVPVRWDEVIDEWVLTEEAHEMIERRKALEMGLLSPGQLLELRTRHGLNQMLMGALFQVGEKSWCRWESGKHRPTRSINLLIRALYDGELSIDYLRRRAGMAAAPAAESRQASYLRSIHVQICSTGSATVRTSSGRRTAAPSRRSLPLATRERITADLSVRWADPELLVV